MANIAIDYRVEVNGKVDPRYTLDSDLNGVVSYTDFLLYIKEHLIIFSDIALNEEQDRGFDKKPVRLVDGQHYKPLSEVKPLGQIEYVARQDLREVLTATFTILFKQSPVLSGAYKSSHVLTYNGLVIATNPQELESWLKTPAANSPQEKDIFRFVNTAPYARRLETLGVSSKRQQSRTRKARGAKKAGGARVNQPNGAYYLTFRSIRSKYGKNVGVFYNLISGTEIGGLGSNVFKSAKNIGKGGARAYLYPSIKIFVKTSGITNV